MFLRDSFNVEDDIIVPSIKTAIGWSDYFFSLNSIDRDCTLFIEKSFDIMSIVRFLTSSSANRVKTYMRAIWWADWDLFGSVFIIDFRVASFFLVGGGWRISEGALGTKPATSSRPKFTAACWHEHVNTTHVSMCLSWSRDWRLFGNSWSTSPSLTGRPLSWISFIQAWSSLSLATSSSDL